MTRIALISDIHANLPALEAVLADARSHEVEAIWNAGDSVGYGPHPAEVLARIQQENIISIRGNYDTRVLTIRQDKEDTRKPRRPEKWLAFNWAYDHLTPETHRFLRNLPEQRLVMTAGWLALLVHGTPLSPKEHLRPETPPDHLRRLARQTPARIILCGHTHLPMVRQSEDTWFINPGSVGRLDDGDARASYALLDLAPGQLELKFRRITYDVPSVTADLRREGLPEAFARMFELGRSLDWVMENDREDVLRITPSA